MAHIKTELFPVNEETFDMVDTYQIESGFKKGEITTSRKTVYTNREASAKGAKRMLQDWGSNLVCTGQATILFEGVTYWHPEFNVFD